MMKLQLKNLYKPEIFNKVVFILGFVGFFSLVMGLMNIYLSHQNSEWQYFTYTSSNGKKLTASQKASDVINLSYNKSSLLGLIITQNIVSFSIMDSQFACDTQCTISISFDNQKDINYTAILENNQLSIQVGNEFFEPLLNAKKLTVNANVLGYGVKTYTFDVSNYKL